VNQTPHRLIPWHAESQPSLCGMVVAVAARVQSPHVEIVVKDFQYQPHDDVLEQSAAHHQTRELSPAPVANLCVAIVARVQHLHYCTLLASALHQHQHRLLAQSQPLSHKYRHLKSRLLAR
jgi:hypothetical protein